MLRDASSPIILIRFRTPCQSPARGVIPLALVSVFPGSRADPVANATG